MKLSPLFVSNIQDTYKADGSAWLKALPEIIRKLEEKRHLELISPMPYLTYHFVGSVQDIATGKQAVLKIAPNSDNISREAKWLSCFDQGVAKLYWYDENYHAYLMEQLVPGEPLKYLVKEDDDKATRIICQLIRDLHGFQHPDFTGFKHLSELAGSLSILQGKIDPILLHKAQDLFSQLCKDKSQDVLLHGDLHHDNILSSGSEWKVIDPHGYIGDPAFASSTMIYNPGDLYPQKCSLSDTIHRRLQILCEELPYDAKRIKAWAFCMTVLSIAWSVEDHGAIPDFDLKVAQILFKM